jgi:hypothetical protein
LLSLLLGQYLPQRCPSLTISEFDLVDAATLHRGNFRKA